MRLHRNLVHTVVDSLEEIFTEDKYADRIVSLALKKDARWGSKDRRFIAEAIYDIVRWKRLYNEIAGTKDHYSKDNIWKLFTVWAVLKGYKLPEWKQFVDVPVRRIRGGFDKFQDNRKIRESIPDWLDEMGEAELGANWEKELHSLNKPAEIVLRVNSLKTNVRMLKTELLKEDIGTHTDRKYPSALILDERKNVFMTDVFKKGGFEMQDASSQLVAPFLEVKPGMRVIDTCAGAGGKTLHLSALMENKGVIIALDIHDHKLKELKKRARRAGAGNIETRHITGTKVIKKMHNTADRILIDAPCSGVGVLKRNPDAKWKLKPEFVENIIKTQAEILESYSKMLKVDGMMVYATCSVFPSENQNQVKNFLANNEGFELIKQKSVLANVSGFDGFFMALIKRTK